MIELTNITKTFKVYERKKDTKTGVKGLLRRDKKIIKALDNISFKIDDGEIVGYIGPNGAGKSTSIKVMCGILTPEKGKCSINGMIPYKEREKYVKNIGAVFGNRSSLWWDVPVVDSFEMNKAIYNIPDDVYQEQKAMLTKMLNIEEIIKKPTRTLSLGQRMRCEIAIAFLHKPKIVFLDEPTIGLDSVSKIAVRKFIKEINKKDGTTIILTTHDTEDIKAMAKRIILVGKGKVLKDCKMSSLTKASREKNQSLDETVANLYKKYKIS